MANLMFKIDSPLRERLRRSAMKANRTLDEHLGAIVQEYLQNEDELDNTVQNLVARGLATILPDGRIVVTDEGKVEVQRMMNAKPPTTH